MSDVPELFEGDVPDREWVLGQGFAFNPTSRKARMPDPAMWPPELDECPGDDTKRTVDRRTVFRVAERAAASPNDPFGALQLHVAAAVWGTGTKGLTAARAYRPLSEPDAGTKLTKALATVRSGGPLSAYKAMSSGGMLKIKHLDVAFFTKFLYFGGWDAKKHMPEPLIYDQHVARAMRHLTKDEEWVNSPPSERYGEYLDLVAWWAAELSTSEDVVERRLYEIGYGLK